jgi:predicted CoA-substrate-specific enzyme activase
MIHAGIDIGSRTIKLAVFNGSELVLTKIIPNTFNPLASCDELLAGVEFDTITATGYGRHLFNTYKKSDVISELKAFAVGASYLNPDCRTVLDIGGQDTKAIFVDGKGGIVKFEMNDKCAAGTGRFLEIMAAALGYKYEEFAAAAIFAERTEPINNMCTVFAESEVISLVTQGIARGEIALGIHKSITSRAVNLLKRVSIRDKVMFAGGVALNSCILGLVCEELGTEVFVPENPQLVGAIGCGIHSMRLHDSGLNSAEVKPEKEKIQF